MADTSVIYRLLAKDETAEGIKSAESKFSGMKSVIGGILGAEAVQGGFDFLKEAVDAGDQVQKIMQLTAGAIASTGGAAGLTAEQVRSLSEELAKTDGVMPMVIQNASNMLLTFTNIRNVGADKIFDEATQAAVNMDAAISHGNVTMDGTQQMAKVLGKALNDPVGSLGALSRMGVQFTQTQKDMIKQEVAHGDALKAQNAILTAVSAKYGNAAAAAATPMQRLRVTLEQVKEELGTKLIPMIDSAILKITPVVSGLAAAFGAIFSTVAAHANVFGPIGLGIAGVAGAIKIATFATDLWKEHILKLWAVVMANPWVALATIVTAVIIYLATKFQAFRDFINEVYHYLAVLQTEFWKNLLDIASYAITHLLDLAGHIPLIGDKFRAAADGVRDFTSTVDGAIDAVQNFNVVNGISSAFSAITNVFKMPTYTAPAFNAGASIPQSFNEGVQKAAPKAKDSLKQLQDQITQALTQFKANLFNKFADMGSVVTAAIAGPPGNTFVVGNLRAALLKAQQFVADIKTLRKAGLNDMAINQLIAAGPDQGAAAARELATSAFSQIGQVNAYQSQLAALGSNFANAQAKAEFGTAKAIAQNKVQLQIDLTGVSNDALVQALRKAIRVKGGNVQSVLGSAA